MRSPVASWSRWLQWALAVSIVAAVGWGVYHQATKRPADTVYITLGELRSRAAEVRQVAERAAREDVTEAYLDAQTRQLAGAVASLRDDLGKARGKGSSSGAAAGYALAGRLLDVARALHERGHSPPDAKSLRDAAAAIVDALLPLERAARPA